jgi:hypothetical protein
MNNNYPLSDTISRKIDSDFQSLKSDYPKNQTNNNTEMSTYTSYPLHVDFNQYYIKDGMKKDQNWSMFERHTIFMALQEYYASSQTFWTAMDTEFNKVIVTSPTHDNGDGAGEHFQLMFINDRNLLSKPRTGYKSGKLHGYFKVNGMGVMSISKITAIVSY